MRKKLFTFLLALVTSVGLMNAAVDDSGSCGDNVTYSFNGTTGEMVISGTGPMTVYTYGSSLLPWKDYKDAITSVVVEDGVTSVSQYSFGQCTNLTTVVIGNDVETIGQFAFNDCGTSFTSLTLGSSLKSVGMAAFLNAKGITTLTLPDGFETVGDYAFCRLEALQTLNIPSSVTSIGTSAFYRCYPLATINCAAVTPPSLGDDAFGDIANKSNIPLYVPSGSVAAYTAADQWKEFKIQGYDPAPVGPTNVCGDGLTWELNGGVLTISYDGEGTGEMYDFGYEYDQNPVNVAPWKENKSAITTVIVGDGVKSIGNYAFNDLYENFTAVTIANSVERIGVSAFMNAKWVTEMTLPSSLKTIDRECFAANFGITSITIPSGVTSIGYHAFGYCTGLTSLTCEATTPPTLASGVFYKITSKTSDMSSIPLYVPSESVSDYQTASQWNAFNIQGYDPTPAETVTVVFEANNNQKEVEVTLPHTFACDFENGNGELDGIIQELYALQYGGYCQAFTVPTATGNAAVTASKDGNNHYIAISEAFEGTATVTGNYIKYLDTEHTGNTSVDYTLTISVQGSTPAVDPAVQNVIDLIDAIGSVTYTQACKDKIDAARAAYDLLTDAQKALVSNYSTLTDAEAAYAALAPQPVSGDVLPGAFTVDGDGKQINFSKTNLQYVGGAWQFAENQWDVIGESQADGNRDLFGWGTGDAPNKVSEDNGNYATFNDWGDNLEGGWRTLTKQEWRYLFDDRETSCTVNNVSNARRTQATINTDGTAVHGVILFPDGYAGGTPAGVTWGTINAGSNWSTTCTTAGWAALEAAGCVFLPAAGQRSADNVANVDVRGFYWSSSLYDWTVGQVCGVAFNQGNCSAWYEDDPNNGFSVRLVKDASSAPASTPVEIGDLNSASEIETFLTNNDGVMIDELIIDRPVLNNMYNTLCLPFNMNAAQIDASSLNGVEIREFTGASVEGTTLNLSVGDPVNAVVAGRPYFVKYSAASQLDDLHFEDVTINKAILDDEAVTFDGVTFKGTFTPFVMPNGLNFQGGYLFLGQNNQLFWPNTSNPLKPFRAYFYVDVESSTPGNAPKYRGMPARIVEGKNVATGVENAQSANQSTKVIVNGQLIIIKNDVRYNAQGQIVK